MLISVDAQTAITHRRPNCAPLLKKTMHRPPDPHVPAEDFFKNLALLRTRALGLLRTCCRDERMFSSVVPADVGQSPDSTFPGVAALLVDAARRLLLLEVTFVEVQPGSTCQARVHLIRFFVGV